MKTIKCSPKNLLLCDVKADMKYKDRSDTLQKLEINVSCDDFLKDIFSYLENLTVVTIAIWLFIFACTH